VAALSTSGCVIPQERVNNDCNWVADPQRHVDERNRRDRSHLTTDAVTAEELAIRYADTHRGFRSRGQYVGAREYAAFREACLEKLFEAIATHHGVQPRTLREVLRQRSVSYDVGVVILPMALLFWIAAAQIICRIEQRFTPDERIARMASLVITSVAIDVGMYQVGSMWSFFAEERLRLRTNHLSYRAFYVPWSRHAIVVLVAGFALFWVVAAWSAWTTRRPTSRRFREPRLSHSMHEGR
jgi:hypothetical protein